MIRSKFLFCALGFFFPGAGFNCLYLQGLKSYWGWLQFAAIIGGISIDKIASTRMACSADRMELESAFLYQLNDYQRLVRDDDRLLLIGRDQNGLRFVQSGKLK